MKPIWILIVSGCLSLASLAADANSNQQSDIWEMVYGAIGLPANGDADGDGWTNAQEAAAGTDPRDPSSFPSLRIITGADGQPAVTWSALAGKKYTLETKAAVGAGSWVTLGPDVTGTGAQAQISLTITGLSSGFFRLRAADQDTDGDGIADWEEIALGYDPLTSRTGRTSQLDSAAILAGMTAGNTISISVYDDTCSERWPDPAVFTVRRSGGLQPLTVNLSFTGTATRDLDYTTSTTGTSVKFAAGVREVFVEIDPIADNLNEPTETVLLTALAGTGYTVAAQNSGTVSILNETATSLPSPKAAARFIIQAAWGPDQDSSGDSDQIPQNVQEVMALGYGAWIDAQLASCDVPIGCSCGEDLGRWGCDTNTNPRTTAA